MNPPSTSFPCTSCNTNGGMMSAQQSQGSVPCSPTSYNNSSSTSPPCCTYPASPPSYYYHQQQVPQPRTMTVPIYPQQQQQNNVNSYHSPCNVSQSSPNAPLLRTRLQNRFPPTSGEVISAPATPPVLNDVQRSMTDTYHRIRSEYVTKEREIQELRQRWEDVTHSNERLKREVCTLKRERTISAKEIEKLKARLEEEEVKARKNLAQHRDEVALHKTRTEDKTKQIMLLEQRNKDLETRCNELFSSHVDQKVENLLGQNDRVNLTEQIGQLTKNLQARNSRLSTLQTRYADLMRENESLKDHLKLQELELKAEKLLKDQILHEEASNLARPSLLNKILKKNKDDSTSTMTFHAICEDQQPEDEVTSYLRKCGILQAAPQPSTSNGTLVVGGEIDMSAAIKRGYDQLLAEVQMLREKFSLEEAAGQKRKLCAETFPSTSTALTKRRAPLAIQQSSELNHSLIERDDDVEILGDNFSTDSVSVDDGERATSNGSNANPQQETQNEDLFILVPVPDSMQQDLASQSQLE